MNTETLIAAGRALFGDRWQTDLAHAIGYSGRMIRRWAAGDADPPPAVQDQIRALIDRRVAELEEVRNLLDHAA